MEEKKIICTACPRGCRLLLHSENGRTNVSGNRCPKGEAYGKQEALCPMRILTTTVACTVPGFSRLAVKTNRELPLAEFPRYMKLLRALTVRKPCVPGDVVAENFAGEGAHIVATGGTV